MIHMFPVLVGGFLGAVTRYVFQNLFNKLLPLSVIPFSILLINLIGSFGLGLIYPKKETMDGSMHILLTTGFLGAFTTFSTFSMEALELMRKYRYIDSFIYITISILGCVFAFLYGYLIMI